MGKASVVVFQKIFLFQADSILFKLFLVLRKICKRYIDLLFKLLQMTVRDALNSALDEEMAADPNVYVMGEEVKILR